MGHLHSKSPAQFSDSNSAPARKSAAAEHHTPSHNPPVRILLAEDDPDIRHLIRSILVSQGYTVFSCSDGRHALEIVHAAPRFDLLITDIQMPHLSGLDLAAHLCAAHPATPIIVMSGNPPSQSALVHIAQRGWHFFLKPISIVPLLDTIEHALASRDVASRNVASREPVEAHHPPHASHPGPALHHKHA